MNFKTTFVLLVLVVAGVFLWVYSGDEKPDAGNADQSTTTSEPKYVFDDQPDKQDAVRLEFVRRDKPTLVFAREPKAEDAGQMTDWRMVEPLESDVETYMVDSLTGLLSGLQYTRTYADGEGGLSLEQAGLAQPAATLKITDKEGREYGVEIGKKAALSNDTYIRVPGKEEILVISRDVSRDLERDTSEFRAKHMLNFRAANARRLYIEHEGTTYELTRGDGDEWIINEPVKAHAKADEVKNLIQALSRLRVAEFAEDAPAALDEYGLADPMLEIEVVTEHTVQLPVKEAAEGEEQPPEDEPQFKTEVKRHRLLVGDYADLKSSERYVKLPDAKWVAVVTQTNLDKLFPKLNELRDSQITYVKADDATRIELTTGDASAALDKKDGRWLGDATLGEADAEAVNALLKAFENARALDYIDHAGDLGEYGLDAPRAVVKVFTAEAVEPTTLRIGGLTPSGHNAYVQIEGQDTVFVVSAARADELAIRPVALRTRDITTLSPAQIQKITLNRGKTRYVLQREADGQKWGMIEPAEAPLDKAIARSLVNDLARLRAKQIMSGGNAGDYGLNAPAITIEFEATAAIEGPQSEDSPTGGETETHVLRVSHVDNLTYALFDDAPYVFQLDKTVYDVFMAEYIRPGLFEIKADDVTRLTIAAPGGTVDFLREGDEWTYPPDPYVKLSQKNVGDFVKEMAELRVAAYMAYRDGDLAQHGLDKAPVAVTLKLADGSTITLHIDQVRTGELPRKAAWVEQRRIFLLRQAEAEKLMRGLDYYLEPEKQEGDQEGQSPD